MALKSHQKKILLGLLGMCGVLSITAVYIPDQANKMNREVIQSTQKSNSMWKNMDTHAREKGGEK